MSPKPVAIALTTIVVVATAAVAADPARQAIIDGYAAQANSTPSVGRGKAFFYATHTGGKPDAASCTSCHGRDPRAGGRTRAGKPIEPLAVSVTPSRFTDPAKVEKWFGRNCKTVLGRACSAAEKADFIVFMSGQ